MVTTLQLDALLITGVFLFVIGFISCSMVNFAIEQNSPINAVPILYDQTIICVDPQDNTRLVQEYTVENVNGMAVCVPDHTYFRGEHNG